MARCWVRVGVTAAVVALTMAGCAQDDAAPEVDPGATTVTSDNNGANRKSGSSDPNDPGPDDPVDQPTLSLPGLPIGGRTYPSIDGNHPDNQCANVNWIVDAAAADLAPGIAVAVTGFEFDPEVFTVASAGCDNDAPPCPGFVFTVDAQVCNLAVAPIPGSDTSLGSYRFALVGHVDCREIGSERCQEFKDAVAAEPGLSLGLDPPFTGTDDDDSDETDGDATDTDATADDSDGTDGDGAVGEKSDDGTAETSDTGSDTGSNSSTGSGE
jgi:hypothetical protein